ncbi:MAG: hypothetical protein KFB93_04485 [Simkaniaceae bacterium]|nr:MAG: hypothetical protein KFB93_04485 [Simkaniaceae bacterium]
MATQAYGHYYRVGYNPYENINRVHSFVESQCKLSAEQLTGINSFFTTLFRKDNVNVSVRADLTGKLTDKAPDKQQILEAIGVVAFRRATPYQMFMYQYSQAILAMFQTAAHHLRPEAQAAASEAMELRELTVHDETMLRCLAAFIEPMGEYYSAHTRELIEAMDAKSSSQTLAALEKNITVHTVGYGEGAWKGTLGRLFG